MTSSKNTMPLVAVVMGSKSEVNEAALGSQALRHRVDESRHIMVGYLQYLLIALVVELRVSELGQVFLGYGAQLGPGFADCQLHLEPLVELALV